MPSVIFGAGAVCPIRKVRLALSVISLLVYSEGVLDRRERGVAMKRLSEKQLALTIRRVVTKKREQPILSLYIPIDPEKSERMAYKGSARSVLGAVEARVPVAQQEAFQEERARVCA